MRGGNLCENLCLEAIVNANSHFISHLVLVKHYHSIIVNLKTMKSSGSKASGFHRKSPFFIDSSMLHIKEISCHSALSDWIQGPVDIKLFKMGSRLHKKNGSGIIPTVVLRER